VVQLLGRHLRAAVRPLCVITCPAYPTLFPLSLHDALPISFSTGTPFLRVWWLWPRLPCTVRSTSQLKPKDLFQPARVASPLWCGDRKSTRLNSSLGSISYAVFCLKKKKTQIHSNSVRILQP